VRARAVAGALVIAGFVVAILVAMLGWSPRGHQPSVFEWVVQAIVLGVVVIIIAARVRRKG